MASEAVKKEIAKIISSFSGLAIDTIVPLIEIPKNSEYGDFSLPIPKLKLKGNPVSLAQEFCSKFEPNKQVTELSHIGPFLNFKINRTQVCSSIVKQILQEKEKFGCNTMGAGKTVVVEYSSPNIAKPFHAGHFRTTIIGNFLKHLYRANGYKVIGINYLGDWGKQYGLLAVGFEKFGSEQELEKDAIKHLFDVYVKINKEAEADPLIHETAKNYFLRMEQGDEKVLGLWRKFRELSIHKYKELYARLNVEFDVYSGESFYDEKMKEIINLLGEKNLLVDSKGAKIVDLEPEGLGKVLILKSDGATLYLTRDLAAMKDRFEEYKFDKMLYVVASQQDLHFKQVFKVCEKLEFPFSKDCLHVNYGMVMGMSTRKGNVVFLEDIIEESKQTMHSVMQANEQKYAQIEDPLKTSEILAVSAMIIQDMSAKRIKDYEFQMDRMTSFEGDTGPYLQFAHSRLCSIERKSQLHVEADQDLSLIVEPEALELAMILTRYPSTVIDAIRAHEACSIVNFLFSLCHQVSATLEKLWVMGQPDEIAKARLALYKAARITLGNGLTLLGIKPLERM